MLTQKRIIYFLLLSQVVCICVSKAHMWSCENGQKIPSNQRCDGIQHCGDGSDESSKNCRCDKNQFRCRNGDCIPKNFECDGKYDCDDRSDERNYECATQKDNEFRKNFAPDPCKQQGLQKCLGEGCVDPTAVCDGKADCVDGSDETEIICSEFSCPSYTFRCRYGACIAGTLRCNGIKDCHDESDEDPSLCENNATHLPILKKCRIPKQKSLTSEDSVTLQIYTRESGVNGNQNLVNFYCDGGLKLLGNSSSICSNGTWLTPPPRCVQKVVCKKLDRDRGLHNVICTRNDRLVECKAPFESGTSVKIECATGYRIGIKEKASLYCNKNGQWSDRSLKCNAICNNFSKIVKSTVSVFKFRRDYTYQCDGYVLSEKIVYVDAECVEYMWTDTHSYIILNARYTRPFKSLRYLGLTYHNVSDIALLRLPLDKESSNIIGLLIIEPDVKFATSLGPLCLNTLFTNIERTSFSNDQTDLYLLNRPNTTITSLNNQMLPSMSNKSYEKRRHEELLKQIISTYRNK